MEMRIKPGTSNYCPHNLLSLGHVPPPAGSWQSLALIWRHSGSRRIRAEVVSFIWTTPNIFGVLAPCLALCWPWPSVSSSDVELISEPRASPEQAASSPGQAPACLWLSSALLPRSPAAAFPLIPTNRQCVRRLPARQAGLQNADKLLLFIRGPDEGFGEALNYRVLGFSVPFS